MSKVKHSLGGGGKRSQISLDQTISQYNSLSLLVLACAAALAIAFIRITFYIDLKPVGEADKVDASVFQSSLVASVGVTGPICLELFQDFSFTIITKIQKRNVFVGKMRYFIGRAILVVGLLIPSCFLLLEIQLGKEYYLRAVMFIVATFIRRILFLASVLFCMASAGSSIFTTNRTCMILLMYIAAQFCELYNINQGEATGNVALQAFSVIFLVLTYLAFAYLVCLWAIKKRITLLAFWRGETVVDVKTHDKDDDRTASTKAPKTAMKVVPEEFYELGILLLSFVSCVASHVVDGQRGWQWGVVDSVEKAGYTYLAILFTSFMSALLGRHSRIAIIIEKENSLEAKKSFIRYISHEIRYARTDLVIDRWINSRS